MPDDPKAALVAAAPRHPRGLWFLSATEMCERISFHSVQAMLTLYLAGELLMPAHVGHVLGFPLLRTTIEAVTGPLSGQALAAQIFGLYISLIYLTPLIGGVIGDRFISRRSAVASGALLMTAGHLMLALDRSFLLGLGLLIIGTGLLRGNLSAQIKALYADGDPREADGFQIFYMALCVGAFVAPLIGGTLAALYGSHVALGFAGIGTLIGLIVYGAGQRALPPDRKRTRATRRAPLTARDCRRLTALLAIWPLIIGFWIAQTQVWNVYNLWVRDHVDLAVGDLMVPIPWLQALDGLAPAILSPCAILLWRWQARFGREPDLLGKLTIGCLVFAGSMGLLALAPLLEGANHRAPLLLPLVFHILSNLGTVYVAPIALALFAAEAPPSARGAMIGVNSLSVFVAGLISGRLGVLYGVVTPSAFWLLHAAIAAASGLTFLLFRRPLARLFAESPTAPIP